MLDDEMPATVVVDPSEITSEEISQPSRSCQSPSSSQRTPSEHLFAKRNTTAWSHMPDEEPICPLDGMVLTGAPPTAFKYCGKCHGLWSKAEDGSWTIEVDRSTSN
jgi:hypothetical protein